MWKKSLVAAAMALATTGCASVHSTDAATEPADPTPQVAAPIEGVYAICVGADSHLESILLRDGEFEHFIQTHGIYGGRSSGTFEVVGDTLLMTVTQIGPAPDGVQQPLTLSYDFVIGEFAGFPVLWRGTTAATGVVPETGAISEYAALFYGGPDPARPVIPSCVQVGAG